MPALEWETLFQRDWDTLTGAQRRAFRAAVAIFVADLVAGTGFRKGLRVKKMQGHEDIWELTWAPDGRATFQFGTEVRPGEMHVVWRRIGTHKIFSRPDAIAEPDRVQASAELGGGAAAVPQQHSSGVRATTPAAAGDAALLEPPPQARPRWRRACGGPTASATDLEYLTLLTGKSGA